MKAKNTIWVSAAFLCLTAAGLGYDFYRYATTPVQTGDDRVVVWIRPGQPFSEIAAQLHEAGLVRHPMKFRWLAYLKGDETRIRAGEHLLRVSMPPWEMLDTLVCGKAFLRKVAVPEGANLWKIGEILERRGFVTQEHFLRVASDPGLIKALGMEGETLEGYLFPETYHFAKGVSAEQIIRVMVSHFRSVFMPQFADRAHAMGMTTHEVITLASMVEKETAKAEERPLIAAVFLNRLNRGMALESDPTVIYGIKDFDGNLTRKDLETRTPYNTYSIKGLPAGPIANPGRASIEAVLYPSEEPYLYFVSKNDGSHHFSTTLAEHDVMVNRYQRGRSGR